MTLTLRNRIILTIVPLLILLAILGGAGTLLIYRLGGSIDLILRENYASVVAMERLNEALERIDSSFQFALAGEEEKARKQYADNWGPYRYNLHVNQENMKEASEKSKALAADSVLWFGAGLAVAGVLAALLALRTIRSLLRPVRAVTESALAIGAGNLD